jgi:type I restriction enzyme, S subunit
VNSPNLLLNQRVGKLIPRYIENDFFYHVLQNGTFRNAMQLKAAGGAQGNLSSVDIGTYIFGAPANVAEQEKIAECLTSLDEVIAAHSRKLHALKAHKKGLTQQLFLREGETQPRLRFPEFRDAGEWKEKQLGDICVLVRGPFGGSLKKEIFVQSGYAVYEQSHAIYEDFTSFRYYIPKAKYDELKRFSVSPGDIIMSCSGTMGKFAIVPEGASGVINQALLKLTVKRSCLPMFLKEVLELPTNQEQLLSQSAGGAIKNVVSVSQIKELKLFIPGLAEQRIIIDCLSSLNELITAQTQKLDALKFHKKGLMQQLFPSSEEVEA